MHTCPECREACHCIYDTCWHCREYQPLTRPEFDDYGRIITDDDD